MTQKISWKWVVLWTLWLARIVRQPTPVLWLKCGALRGSVAHDGSHLQYFGIPYATLGPERRFKAPGPEPKWQGVYEAINENIRCTQKITDNIAIGQAECLVLNVYTPTDVTVNSQLPVMVFIHGGGFFQGSGSRMIYGPEYIVAKNVILVTLNYRLNIQGFLCLRTKDAPGNAGMKDQVAALRWVQRHIERFGGDPDNVTIFGESAGAASVSYHVLSPMSAGLFHKAILQSGSSLAPWAHQLRPVYMASLLAKVMLYNTEDPKELYNIFMNKSDAELIITRVPRKEGNILITEILYCPCTETVIEGEEPFLTGVPYDLISRGKYNKVPMIIGANIEEGYLFASMENSTMLPKIAFEKSLPKDLTIPNEKERKEIAEKLKTMYMGDKEISKESILRLSRFYGDMYFTLPSVTETELILKTTNQPVFSYIFSHDSWRNLVSLTLGGSPGATHADDLFYLFKSFQMSFTLFNDPMIDTVTTLWTNFAKFGAPSAPGVQWLPANQEAPQRLDITLEPRMRPLVESPTLRYWQQLYRKHRRRDYG